VTLTEEEREHYLDNYPDLEQVLREKFNRPLA
jgi:hypothetical protein